MVSFLSADLAVSAVLLVELVKGSLIIQFWGRISCIEVGAAEMPADNI